MMPGMTTPLKVGEIAKLVGWPPRRVRRMLDRIETTEPGTITRIGLLRERHITLASLRRLWPDFAARLADPQDVECITADVGDLQELVGRQAGLLQSFAQRLTRLERLIVPSPRGGRRAQVTAELPLFPGWQ